MVSYENTYTTPGGVCLSYLPSFANSQQSVVVYIKEPLTWPQVRLTMRLQVDPKEEVLVKVV